MHKLKNVAEASLWGGLGATAAILGLNLITWAYTKLKNS